MKKILLLAICLMSFACVKAQLYYTHTYTDGHLSVTVTDSMWHDSTQCIGHDIIKFYVTVDSSFVGDTVRIIDSPAALLIGAYGNTTGASPWTFTGYSSYMSTPDQWITPTGHIDFFHYVSTKKITHQLDTIYVHNYDSLFVPDPCEYGTASGRIYIDNNANCVFDAGDHAVTSSPVKLLEHFSGAIPTLDQQSPQPSLYTLTVQKSWMTDYSIYLPPSYTFIFPYAPCYAGPYTYTTLPQTGVDFPLTCTSNIDVQCDILSENRIRLHTPFYIQPYVSNTGCDTASGHMTLIKDSRAIYDAALSIHPADYVNGDTLVWTYHNLTNVASGAYWNSFFSHIHFTHDTTVMVGDTLCFRVYTNIPAADVNITNNDRTICLPVVYSYDPNLKEVLPQGTGPQGYIAPSDDTLTYTLHFQNTGSAEAYDIKVIDTLDSHINPSSLKILGTSHNMDPEWLAPNVVQFTFKNIHLPDSTSNEAASHGQVRFTVALNPGLAVGTKIKNTGYIYFDLNPPVVTNTTLNTIHVPTIISVAGVTPGTKLYPNPATDHLIVENLSGGHLSIVDMKGVIVLTQEITTSRATIDVSKLPAGVYLLKTASEGNTTATRFTKY